MKKFKTNQARQAMQNQIQVSLSSLWDSFDNDQATSWAQLGESFRCIAMNLVTLGELEHGKKRDVGAFFGSIMNDVLASAVPKVFYKINVFSSSIKKPQLISKFRKQKGVLRRPLNR